MKSGLANDHPRALERLYEAREYNIRLVAAIKHALSLYDEADEETPTVRVVRNMVNVLRKAIRPIEETADNG